MKQSVPLPENLTPMGSGSNCLNLAKHILCALSVILLLAGPAYATNPRPDPSPGPTPKCPGDGCKGVPSKKEVVSQGLEEKKTAPFKRDHSLIQKRRNIALQRLKGPKSLNGKEGAELGSIEYNVTLGKVHCIDESGKFQSNQFNWSFYAETMDTDFLNYAITASELRDLIKGAEVIATGTQEGAGPAQVLTDNTLVNIGATYIYCTPDHRGSSTLQVYKRSQVGEKVNGVYAVTGSPFKSVTITVPEGKTVNVVTWDTYYNEDGTESSYHATHTYPTEVDITSTEIKNGTPSTRMWRYSCPVSESVLVTATNQMATGEYDYVGGHLDPQTGELVGGTWVPHYDNLGCMAILPEHWAPRGDWILEELVPENSGEFTLVRKTTSYDNTYHGSPLKTRKVEELDSLGNMIVKSFTRENYVWVEGTGMSIESGTTYGDAQGTIPTSITTYYTNGDNLGNIKTIRRSDGYWENWSYTKGNSGVLTTKTVSSWLDASSGGGDWTTEAGVAESLARVVVTTKDSKGTLSSREEKIKGVTVASENTKIEPLSNGDIKQTQTVMAGTNALITTTICENKSSSNIVAAGRPKSIQSPDGTVKLFSYSLDGDGNLTTTESSGAGSLGGVTDGTRTVTRTDLAENVLVVVRTDIASGVEIYRDTADLSSLDNWGAPQQWYYGNDSSDYEIRRGGCCGSTEYTRDRDGKETSFVYDGLKREVHRISGYPGQSQQVLETAYDGLTTTVTRTSGSSSQFVSEKTTDFIGNVIEEKTPDSNGDGVPEITYIDTSSGGRIVTRTKPDGSVNVTEKYLDGQVKRTVERQGWSTELITVFEYGTHSEQGGGLWKKQTQNGARWTKTYTNLNGVLFKEEHPVLVSGTTVNAATTYELDFAGRVVKSNPPRGAPTLTHYNSKGEAYETVLDMDNDGNVSAPDRVHRTYSNVVSTCDLGGKSFGAGTLVRHSVLNDLGDEIFLFRFWTSIDGLNTASESRRLVSTSAKTKPVDGSWSVTGTAADNTTQVQNFENGVLKETISYASGISTPLSHTLYGYDDLGRQTTQTERRHLSAGGGNSTTDFTTTTTYFDDGQVKSVTTPYDDANQTGGTVYTRDSLGRAISVRLPDGSTRTTEYRDAEGVTRVGGSQTYPNETKIDPFGQRISLTTWRDYAGQSGCSVTKWIFEPETGLLARKEYADGRRTDYTYDSAGNLISRTWARGIVTTYTYTGAGQMETVTYSDGVTPGFANTYDRNGNLLSSGQTSYTYDPSTILRLTETMPINSTSVTRTLSSRRDVLLRDTGFDLVSSSGTEVSTRWAYDPAGRVEAVSGTSIAGPGTQTFTYHWVDGRPSLIARVDGPVHTVTNTWELLRPVLTSKANRETFSAGGALISGYNYSVNSLQQRASVMHAGSAFSSGTGFNLYGYDSMGQLTSARRYAGGTPEEPMNAVDDYQFGFGYDSIGNRTTGTHGSFNCSYSSNILNQYSAISSGSSTYDEDGNLLNGAGQTYTWDAENQLIGITRPDGTEISCAYDTFGRRIRKTVKNGTVIVSDLGFLYDGWNLVAKYDLADRSDPTLDAANFWGLDISNTRRDAGGVGGLLSVTMGGAFYSFTYDGNSNVSELLAANGTIVAHYEYGPFGEPVSATGPMAAQNTFQFSTKYTDSETGLIYYGYRYYSPITGRWIGRDPIEEAGGANLYGFIYNDGINRWDYLGHSISIFNGDTDMIPLVNGEVESPDAAAETTVRNWIFSGRCDLTWFSYIFNGNTEVLSLTGYLDLRIIKRPGTNENYIDPTHKTGYSNAQHERYHARVCKAAFNKAAAKANAYEGKYCSGCCDKALRLALAIMTYAKEEQFLEQMAFDKYDYGGGALRKWQENLYSNAWKELQAAQADYDKSNCAKR